MKGVPAWVRPTSRQRRFSTAFFFVALAMLATLTALSLLGASPCALPGAGRHCYHGYSSDFSFNAKASPARAAWMAALPDSVNISSLSLPGTHDTMTYGLSTDLALQCHNKDLATQLRAGMRYFDIRGRLSQRTIRVYHAYRWTGFTFSQVLEEMFEFLDENPEEALVVRLKEEGPPLNDDTGRSFEEAFLYFLNKDPLLGRQFKKRLYLPPAADPSAGDKREEEQTKDDDGADKGQGRAFVPLPTLGDLRGKILLLQNFPTARDSGLAPYGVAWDGPQMRLEDLWVIPSPAELPLKWEAVHDALVKARDGPDDNAVLFLAHLSASVGVLPIEAAAGPIRGLRRGGDGINDLTGRWLTSGGDGAGMGRTGIVIIDFPGQELIDAVLERNDVFLTRRDAGEGARSLVP